MTPTDKPMTVEALMTLAYSSVGSAHELRAAIEQYGKEQYARGVNDVWPAGRGSGESVGQVFGIIDPDYARVFTHARIVAWQYGYACLAHGSFTRDLDLLLVPWTGTAKADDVDYFAPRIANAAGLKVQNPPSVRPHGRKTWTLLFPGFADPRWVDLSVLSPTAAQHSGPLTDEQIERLRGLDTGARVRFYERDFYPLSNFSAFTLYWRGLRFDTSEAAYHFEKFPDHPEIRAAIKNADSAHEAFKYAERMKQHRRPDWDDVKVGVMREILRAKVEQHEYVKRKLLDTGDRELVEDSWRDAFWGWGPNRDGQNMLGKLWMEIREELRAHNIRSAG